MLVLDADALNALGNTYVVVGRHRDAAVTFGKLFDASRALFGDRHPATLETEESLGFAWLAHKDANLAVGGAGIVSGMSPKGGFDIAGLELYLPLLELSRRLTQRARGGQEAP